MPETTIESEPQSQIKTGIVFRPGNYTDKGIGVATEDDMDAIVAASTEPVPVKNTHLKDDACYFAGKLGKAFNFRVGYDDKGTKVVLGDWEEPAWLSALERGMPRPISAAFEDWHTRKIDEVSLARYPRVSDAAYFNAAKEAYVAFSQGQPVQPLEVEQSPETLSFSDCTKLAIDKTFDLPQNKSRSQETITVGNQIETPNAALVPEVTPSALEKLKAFFGWSPEQSASAQAIFAQGKSAREIELENENARYKTEAETRRQAEFSANAQSRAATAAQMADALLKEHRIKPHEVEAVKAEFSRALDDDASNPKAVTFSVKGDNEADAKDVAMSRAERLQALYSKAPVIDPTSEAVREFAPETYAAFSQEATQLRNAEPNNEVDQSARRAALENSGGLGQAALSQLNGATQQNGNANGNGAPVVATK